MLTVPLHQLILDCNAFRRWSDVRKSKLNLVRTAKKRKQNVDAIVCRLAIVETDMTFECAFGDEHGLALTESFGSWW